MVREENIIKVKVLFNHPQDMKFQGMKWKGLKIGYNEQYNINNIIKAQKGHIKEFTVIYRVQFSKNALKKIPANKLQRIVKMKDSPLNTYNDLNMLRQGELPIIGNDYDEYWM